MELSTTYSVGAFAKLAGVTVRTLHFYDEVGLLKPSHRTSNQRRWYQEADLLRLQQILTLRQIGFSLQQIQGLLGSPTYDLRDLLRLQKQALDEQILQLQGVSYALGRTLEAVEKGQPINWQQVVTVIRDLSETHRQDWLREHFPAEEWSWVHERAVQMPSELVQASAKAWENLYADFQGCQHLAPDHPDVQKLAAQMQHLLEMFTEGNPALEDSLKAFYSDPAAIPPTYRFNHDLSLQEFMCQALAVYQEKGTS